MNYCIKNSKEVYIKLNNNGQPVTCSSSEKGEFEYSKAKNIFNNLPKVMKKFHFRVDAIPEIKSKEIKEVKEKILKDAGYYKLSEDVIGWIDKFGTCADILNEAKDRKKQLQEALSNVDRELLNILHIIEIEPPKDLYRGWLLYKQIRENRIRRRKIKDEALIIGNILKRINSSYMERENVRNAVNGLMNRKYTFRIVEEGDEGADL